VAKDVADKVFAVHVRHDFVVEFSWLRKVSVGMFVRLVYGNARNFKGRFRRVHVGFGSAEANWVGVWCVAFISVKTHVALALVVFGFNGFRLVNGLM